ncbi:MAG: hypothetical protein D6814_10925 [Calditrichaeota bacterium]|nr:MAG: hypothetical protein D6814_10925 [Calditrichota bacterium]
MESNRISLAGPISQKKHDRGFALLEALLSVLLLSVGLVAVVQAFQGSFRLVEVRRHDLTPARELAESLLAQLETGTLETVSLEPGTWEGSQNRFEYRVTVTPWPRLPDLYQVEVTVAWVDRGKPGQIRLTTLLPNNAKRQP